MIFVSDPKIISNPNIFSDPKIDKIMFIGGKNGIFRGIQEMVWRKRIYILEQGTQEKGVAISYDSRKMSKEFSLQIVLILNAR